MSSALQRVEAGAGKIPPAAVLAFLDEIREKDLEFHSLMLLVDGVVEAEGWWVPYAPQHPHMLFSLSKSFAATAIGLAEAEGLLSVEDRVAPFFAESLPEQPSAYMLQMRIHDLLSMSTGHDKESLEMLEKQLPAESDWVSLFLRSYLDHEPGRHFQYNSGATYMLSAIVQKVSGQTLLEYLQPRLFEPLGIRPPTWESCPKGINVGGWGLSLTTEDIAKFGQLYLQKGVWQGTRILSENWVERATSAQIVSGNDPDSDWSQGYGYQFWRCRHGAYRGDGMFGQYCIVLPKLQAVIAITSAVHDMQEVLNAVWKHLLPGLEAASAGGGRANPADAKLLDSRLRALAISLPQEHSVSPLEASVRGRRYVLAGNIHHLHELAFDFRDEDLVVSLQDGNGQHRFLCGRGKWKESHTRQVRKEWSQAVAGSFTWQDDGSLLVTQIFLETPFRVQMECRFDGDELLAVLTQNTGAEKCSILGKAQ